MYRKYNTKKEVVDVDGKLREVTTFHDEKGGIFHKMIAPLGSEFHTKDIFQVIIGSSIIAIPVGYTEETWALGSSLPLINIILFLILSFLFVSMFTYYHYFENGIKSNPKNFSKRVVLTYVLSFFVVAILLTLIQKASWSADLFLSLKRTIIVTFPASMSAAIADTLK